jgi:hypothetical protein
MDMAEVSDRMQVGAEEKSRAAHYLTTTRDRLLQILDGLCDQQLTFKPKSDRWSITEIVEHLVLFEKPCSRCT